MPNAERRIQKTPRQFQGALAAEELVCWLNQPFQSASHKRVRDLLQKYWRIARGQEPDLYTAMEDLRECCRRYTYFHQLMPVPNFKWNRALWFPASRSKKYAHGWADEYDEMNAGYDLAELSGAGLLEQLLQCRCGKFFFQKFSHQRFCGAKCRLEEFRNNPEVRAKRNADARRVYQLRKSGKVK